LSLAAGVAQTIAGAFGEKAGTTAKLGTSVASNFVGDYLHTF
jgi:hypothetical protein